MNRLRSSRPLTATRQASTQNESAPVTTGAVSTVDEFIKSALFMVQGQNLFIENKEVLYQLYTQSMSWICEFIKKRRTVSISPLVESTSNPKWYVFPPGFLAWTTLPQPELFQKLDDNGIWIFKFTTAGALWSATSVATNAMRIDNPDDKNTYLQYISIPDLRMCGAIFIEAAMWRFLKLLIGSQDSITKNAQLIMSEAERSLTVLNTITDSENRRYSKELARPWA